MRNHIIVGALLLAGCAASEAKEAERQYDIVSKGRDNVAKCTAAREVERAWLKAENEAKYEHWSALARSHCYLASVRPIDADGLLRDTALESVIVGADKAPAVDNTKIDQSASGNSADAAE